MCPHVNDHFVFRFDWGWCHRGLCGLIANFQGTSALQRAHEMIESLDGANQKAIVSVLQEAIVKLKVVLQSRLGKEKKGIKRPNSIIRRSGISGRELGENMSKFRIRLYRLPCVKTSTIFRAVILVRFSQIVNLQSMKMTVSWERNLRHVPI